MKPKPKFNQINTFTFRRYVWLIALSTLLLGGCNRGCTLTRTLKTSTKKVEINGVQAKIKAFFKKTSRYRRNSRKLFDLTKTSSSYHINVKLYMQDEVFDVQYIPAKKKDKRKLRDYLDKVKFTTTANNYYIIASYENKIQVIFQKMVKMYHYSPYFETYHGKLLSEVNLTNLPTEATFLRDVINHRVKVLQGKMRTKADSAFVRYFTQQTLSEADCITFFKEWPSKALASYYFTPARIKAIKEKYPQWKAVAKESVRKFLEERNGFMNKYIPNYVQLFLTLSSEEEVQKMDASLVDKWGKTFDRVATTYFLERLRLKDEVNIPLDKAHLAKIEAKCLKNLQAYPEKVDYRSGDRVKDKEKVVEFLLLNKNYKVIQDALPRILVKKDFWKNEYNIKKMVGKNYELFPAQMKQQIVDFYEAIFYENLPENQAENNQTKNDQTEENANNGISRSKGRQSMDLAGVYNFLRDKISCPKLKKMRKQYRANFDRGSIVFLEESVNCDF